ncbi:MAG: response regulator [Polyangiaceae bacterium]
METRDPARVPVLVVDDVAPNLLALQAVLGNEGYELVDACSGAEAVAAVAQREFAVVLLDARMPGMDGFETAARLRHAVVGRRPVPIIFVTAADENEDQIRRAYEAGAADFISKPLDGTVLKAKVRIFADLYRAHQHLAESELRFHHLVDAVVDSSGAKDGSRTRDGAFARMGAASGRASSSPRSTARTARFAASRRSRAT